MYEITYLNLEENQSYEKTVEKVLHKCFEEEDLLDSKLIITITFTSTARSIEPIINIIIFNNIIHNTTATINSMIILT